MKFKLVNIDSIKIPEKRLRRREDVSENLEELKKSIRRTGWYGPIVVDKDMVLRAGERRLLALRQEGAKNVWVQVVEEDVDPVVFELAENHVRNNLRWQDVAEAVKEYVEKYGFNKACELLPFSKSTISKYMQVIKSPNYEELLASSSLDEAIALAKSGGEGESGHEHEEKDDEIKHEKHPRQTVKSEEGGYDENMLKIFNLWQILIGVEKEINKLSLCPLHRKATISLSRVRLSCGHTLEDVINMLGEGHHER